MAKLLWLAIHDIENKPAQARTKETDRPKSQPRTTPGYPIEGTTTQSWKPTLGSLLIAFPDRLNHYTN